ncbi:2-dehydro-3-deoxygluconokinase [bacterium A37T11]|nr:2-dehydro-3-deoxygluconokinase [bacterium A37T11]
MDQQKILLFGELLLRFSAGSDQFIHAGNLSIYPGGSEANVAASLGHWKLPASYVSCVPDNELANQALNELTRLGVNTSLSIREGDRIGLYFLLTPNGLSKGEVVYDRKYSAFSQLKPGNIDWEKLLEGHSWFHFTALTPALNDDLAQVILEGLETAHKKGLTISVDLNYRNKLWNYGKQPKEVMPQLVKYADVIMGNIWAANTMLNIPVDETLNRETPVNQYADHANQSATDLFALYPQCKHVAYTFRFMDSPKHNLFYGTYHTRGINYVSEVHETFGVIDRIGSGDAFMAGLIYALSIGKNGQEVIETATSAGFQKLFVKGDFGDGSL